MKNATNNQVTPQSRQAFEVAQIMAQGEGVTRETIAREAFWGRHDSLMALVNESYGYEMDGMRYPANGLTLAEVIATVKTLDAETIITLLDNDRHLADEGAQAEERIPISPDGINPAWGIGPKCSGWVNKCLCDV